MRTVSRSRLLVLLLGLIAVSTVQAAFRNLTIAEFIQEADRVPVTDTLALFVNSKGSVSRKFLDKQLNRTVTDLNLVFPGLHIVLLDKQHRGSLKISDPLFTRFGVVDFPSAALFINGIKIEFTGRLRSQRLIGFVNRRYNSAPIPISDLLTLDQLPAERLLFFYYSEDATMPQLARGLASKFAKSQFVHLMRKDLVDGFAARYGFTPQPWNHTILLSRRPQDGTYRQLSLPKEERRPLLRKIVRFIVQSSKLPSQHFTEHSAQEISKFLRYGRAVMFFYFDPSANKTQAELIADFAEKNYRRMLARFISPSNGLGREYLESIGFQPELGRIYLITRRIDKMYHKFVLNPKTKFTKANVAEFLTDCLDGTYKEFFMSENPPSTELFAGLRTLVGKTIGQLVFDEKEYYHIVFLVDRHTVQAVPKFQKMALGFKHEKARFYMFDTEKNEHRLIDPEHEGNILVFSKKLKVKKVFRLDKTFDLKKFGGFLQKQFAGDKDFVRQVLASQVWQDL